ncbi:MAG TPA: hypothetical protein VEB67_03230, partial [Nitrososphaerales archaeon]|nr:hypothetical protein [Nitrososphaerales archaeon]
MPKAIEASDFTKYSTLSEPSFSPDGRKVAYSVKRANLEDDLYDSDVYIADVKSGTTAAFTSGKRDLDPRWSPDGRSILFVSRRGLKKDEKGNSLYVIPSEGGEARLVRRSEEGIDGPQWSPDSKSIYYLSFVSKKPKDDVKVIDRLTFWFNGLGFVYNRRKHLFVVDVGTGKVRQLTKGAQDLSEFAISHDGKRAAYLSSSDDIRPYISDAIVMDLARGTKVKVTKSNMELSAVAWSPDDSNLALAGDELPAGFASHTRVWVADLKSKRLQRAERVDRNKSNALNSDARAKAHGPGNLVWNGEGIHFLQADGGSVRLYVVKPGESPKLVVGGDRSIEGYDVSESGVAVVSMDSTHLEELVHIGSKERVVSSHNAGVY